MQDKPLSRRVGRIVAGAYYDHQEVRIGCMNRMRDIVWRKNEGIPYDKKIDKKKEKSYGGYKDSEMLKILSEMRKENKITTSEETYMKKLVNNAIRESDTEKFYKVLMNEYIVQEDIYLKFLKNIKGISTVLSANLIKNLGYCKTFEKASAIWKYCGMHVVDNIAPKKEYGKKTNWSPAMRSLCWKIADSFIKQRTPYYRRLYDVRKAKELERTDENKPKNKLHADLRARRFMVKRFLQHYWCCGRELEGLPVRDPWIIGKGGKHVHYEKWQDAVKKNKEAKMK